MAHELSAVIYVLHINFVAGGWHKNTFNSNLVFVWQTPKELTQQDIDNLFAGLYKDFTRIVMYAMCDLKYLKKHSAVAVPATDKHDKDRAMLPQELITKIIGKITSAFLMKPRIYIW